MLLFIKHNDTLHLADITLDAAGKISAVKISVNSYRTTPIVFVAVELAAFAKKFKAYTPNEGLSHAYFITPDTTLLQVSFQVLANTFLPRVVSRFIDGEWQRTTDYPIAETGITSNDYLDLLPDVKTTLDTLFIRYLQANPSWENEQQREFADVLPSAETTVLTPFQQHTFSAILKTYLEIHLRQAASHEEYVESLEAVILGNADEKKLARWSVKTNANSKALRFNLFPTCINSVISPPAFYAETKNVKAQAVTIADVQQYLYGVLIAQLKRVAPNIAITCPKVSASANVAIGKLTDHSALKFLHTLSDTAEATLLQTFNLIQCTSVANFFSFLAKLTDTQMLAIANLLSAMKDGRFEDEQEQVANELVAFAHAAGLELDQKLAMYEKEMANCRRIAAAVRNVAEPAGPLLMRNVINLCCFIALSETTIDAHLTAMSVAELNFLLQLAENIQQNRSGCLPVFIVKINRFDETRFATRVAGLRNIVIGCREAAALIAASSSEVFEKANVASGKNRTCSVLPILIRTSQDLNSILKLPGYGRILELIFPFHYHRITDPNHLLNNCDDLVTALTGVDIRTIENFISRGFLEMAHRRQILQTTNDFLRFVTVINGSFSIMKSVIWDLGDKELEQRVLPCLTTLDELKAAFASNSAYQTVGMALALQVATDPTQIEALIIECFIEACTAYKNQSLPAQTTALTTLLKEARYLLRLTDSHIKIVALIPEIKELLCSDTPEMIAFMPTFLNSEYIQNVFGNPEASIMQQVLVSPSSFNEYRKLACTLYISRRSISFLSDDSNSQIKNMLNNIPDDNTPASFQALITIIRQNLLTAIANNKDHAGLNNNKIWVARAKFYAELKSATAHLFNQNTEQSEQRKSPRQ